MIVYKNVCKENGKYYSYGYPDFPYIEYKIGKFVYPEIKNSHLFAFKTLEAAQRYCYTSHIFEAEATIVSFPKLFMIDDIDGKRTITRMITKLSSYMKKHHCSIRKAMYDLDPTDPLFNKEDLFYTNIVGCTKIKLLKQVNI